MQRGPAGVTAQRGSAATEPEDRQRRPLRPEPVAPQPADEAAPDADSVTPDADSVTPDADSVTPDAVGEAAPDRPGSVPVRADDAHGSRHIGERLVTGILWIAAVALIAIGGAGMLAGMDHPPGTPSRAELTWAADQLLAPELDQVAADLASLSDQVDQLGSEGRRILAAVANRDQETLSAAIEAGTELQGRVRTGVDALRARLDAMPVSDRYAILRISLTALARHQLALEAVDATRGIDEAWDRLASGASVAGILARLLADHDVEMAAAADQGRSQDYAGAMVAIAEALALLDQATVLRNQVAATSDITTLDQWIRRNRTFDEALSDLYAAYRESNGFVTQEVAAAFAREEAARAQLPPDTRGLVLIMSDISQGGLNQSVIAIEQAGQRMSHALETLPDSGGALQGSAMVGMVGVPDAAAGE